MYYLIMILGIALDQIVKFIVRSEIAYGTKIPVIKDFFYITYHENRGAAWGILQNQRILFIVLTILMIGLLFYILARSYNRVLKLALSMIIAGAVGNLIDRCVKTGGVPDFLDFYFGKYNFPTFNVADMFISCGAILLGVYMIFLYKQGDVNIRLFRKKSK
jgi:signal peptidase II